MEPLVSVLPDMELKPNCGSDRAWVWTTLADFADGESKPELLAIRFANAESKYNVHLVIHLINALIYKRSDSLVKNL